MIAVETSPAASETKLVVGGLFEDMLPEIVRVQGRGAGLGQLSKSAQLCPDAAPRAGITEKVIAWETLPEVALIDKEPTAMAVTRPLSETVAVEVAPDDQVTDEVMFCEVASE